MDQTYCYYCMNPLNGQTVCPVCGTPVGTTGTSEHKPFYLMPGSTLHGGRYLLGRVLGAGGFGITYIGFDTVLRFRVAIKEYFLMNYATRMPSDPNVVMHSTSYLQTFDQGKERFLHEAQILASMDKVPAIVDVKDFFEENGTAYIVMEFIQGTTLKEVVQARGGRIPPEEMFPLIEPLFRAMIKVHEKGLIHRDIAPDNLMLENGDIRLLDFGCAREATTGSETMTIMLKPGFAPLEQYDGRGQGPWTDVYALCATLYFCLTGEVPPPATYRFRQDSLIPPSAMGIRLEPQVEQALLTGMAVEPENRRIDVAGLHAAFYGGQNRRESEGYSRTGRGAGASQPQQPEARHPSMNVTQIPERPPQVTDTPPRPPEPVREPEGPKSPQTTAQTASQNTASQLSGGAGPKKPVLLWALIPLLVLLLGAGVFTLTRPKGGAQEPSVPVVAETETEPQTEEDTAQEDTTDTTDTTTDNTTGNTTSPTLSPGSGNNPGTIHAPEIKPASGSTTTLIRDKGQEEEESKTLVGASGFGAVPMETIEQLPKSISCDKWKTDRTLQGIEWNTDTLDTFYVCYSSCIVAYDNEGKVKGQCNDVGDAQLFSMDYYDGYVLSVMRSSGNSRLKLRVYDADTLKLKNSVDLSDIKEQHSEDKDTYHNKDLKPFLGGVMVSPAIGTQKGEKLYVSYNCYADEHNTIGLHEKQMIFEYDFRKAVKAKKSIKAKRVLTVDVGDVEYGIQTLEYDRSTGNVWCGVHEGLTDFPLYCIKGTCKEKKLTTVKNDGLKGWDCAPAESGLCSLGNDQFYVPVVKTKKHAVTVKLKKAALSELEDLS